MKRLFSVLVFLLCLTVADTALAGKISGSLNVSVTVLPPPEERLQAPAPTTGFQHMENQSGDHWVVEASAADAIAAYTQQLRSAGFHAMDAAGTQWSNGQVGVMVSAIDAMSSKPISRLSVMAYDIQRQDARIAAARARKAGVDTNTLVASN